MFPGEGQLVGGRVSSMLSSASGSKLLYCPIRSTETILFSSWQYIQATTNRELFKFIP